MSKPSKPTGAPEIEITPEMIIAGIAEISGFELIDAWEGFLGKSDLVCSIYKAMAQEKSHKSGKVASS